jgi:transcriptional regulator with XRE-family HTH domain
MLMADKRHFSLADLKSVGLRIKACRVLTGLNQEEFATKHSFSLPSVKSWEFGRVIPRLDGLQKLSEAFRVDGIFVKTNWMLFGEGTGPSFGLDHLLNNDSEIFSFSALSLKYVENFKAECKRNRQNPIITTIQDDEMSPYYRRGDIVAGILVNEEELATNNIQGNVLLPMLSVLPNGTYIPRWVHVLPEGIYISSNLNPHIKKLNPVSVAKIYWHLHS